jgi:hypothetical protein
MYSPSTSIVTLQKGKTIVSKDFPCSYTIYSLETFKSNNYLKEQLSLKGDVYKGVRHDCFISYFDVQPPTIEDNFTLDLSSLERNGELIKIPRIHFSKGMRR